MQVPWTNQAPSQSKESEYEELKKVLEGGVYMYIFPWSVVRDHKEDLVALMATDNFDHAYGLMESEVRCLRSVYNAILEITPKTGQSHFDCVCNKVFRLAGQKWNRLDIQYLWNCVKTTAGLHLKSILDFWDFSGLEGVMTLDTKFFGGLASLPETLPWTRVALFCAQCMSDANEDPKNVVYVGTLQIAN